MKNEHASIENKFPYEWHIYAVKTFFFVGIVVSKYNATLVLSSP